MQLQLVILRAVVQHPGQFKSFERGGHFHIDQFKYTPAKLLWTVIAAFTVLSVTCPCILAANPATKAPGSPNKSPAANSKGSAAGASTDTWRKTVRDNISLADEKVKVGEVGTARHLIDQAITTVKEQGSEEDRLMADCLITEGRIQIQEGNKGLAEDSLKQALDIRRKILKPGDKQVCDLIEEYAVLLDNMGRKAEAEKLREEVAVERAKERVAGATTASSGTTTNICDKAIELARQATTAGDREGAFAQWKLALAAAEKQSINDPRIGYCLLKLSDEYLQKKDYSQSEQSLKRAIEVLKGGSHETSNCTAMALRRLAYLEFMNKNMQRASDLYSKALEMENRVNADPRIIATTVQQVASISMVSKDFSRVEQACKQLQELSSQLTGASKTYARITATSLLGAIYMQTGRSREGMDLLKQISNMQPANATEYGKQLSADIIDAERLTDDRMYKELQKK